MKINNIKSGDDFGLYVICKDDSIVQNQADVEAFFDSIEHTLNLFGYSIRAKGEWSKFRKTMKQHDKRVEEIIKEANENMKKIRGDLNELS